VALFFHSFLLIMAFSKKNQLPGADAADREAQESVRTYRGIKILEEAIQAEANDQFPMDRRGVDYAFGDIEIEDGQGGLVPVRDLTDALTEPRYENGEELLQGIRQALHTRKQSAA